MEFDERSSRPLDRFDVEVLIDGALVLVAGRVRRRDVTLRREERGGFREIVGADEQIHVSHRTERDVGVDPLHEIGSLQHGQVDPRGAEVLQQPAHVAEGAGVARADGECGLAQALPDLRRDDDPRGLEVPVEGRSDAMAIREVEDLDPSSRGDAGKGRSIDLSEPEAEEEALE